MTEKFVSNLGEIMYRAGYDYNPVPVFSATLDVWTKLEGSMAYFYIVFQPAHLADFANLKAHADDAFAKYAAAHNMRHIIVINIFAGEFEDKRDIEKLLPPPAPFAMQPKYDIFYGVDTKESQIMRNMVQPANMDDSLGKIKGATQPAAFPEKPQATDVRAKPIAKYPIFCYIIMAVNFVLFAMMELAGGSTSLPVLYRFGAANFHNIFVLGEVQRLVTPIFLHIGVMHLLFNTASMILFGIRAEKYFGHIRFIIIYMTAGIAGNIALVLASPMALGAGASGAIFGAMGALLAFTKVRKKNIENFNTAILAIMAFMGIAIGLTGFLTPGEGNVSNAAHIAGLAAGLLVGWIVVPKANYEL